MGSVVLALVWAGLSLGAGAWADPGIARDQARGSVLAPDRSPVGSTHPVSEAPYGTGMSSLEGTRRWARPASAETVRGAIAVAPEQVITLQIDGVAREIATTQTTVGAILAAARIGIGPLDQVVPSLSTEIGAGAVIRVLRGQREIAVADQAVTYQTRWQGEDALPLDRQELRVAGAYGNRRTRTLRVRRYGQEPQALHAVSWLTQEPVHKQIAFGTRLTPAVLETAEAGTVTYWRKVRMFATSYSAARSGTPSHAPWYGFTYSGHPMGNGVLAMHKWVPLCTKVFVPGYGVGQVLDRGGGLGVFDIDLGYQDEDWRTWSQWVDVYLLWPPPADPARITWILPAADHAGTGGNENPDCVAGRLRSGTQPCVCAPSG